MKAKKFITLLLVAVMVISLLPIFASASPDNSYSNNEIEESEQALQSIAEEKELITDEIISEDAKDEPEEAEDEPVSEPENAEEEPSPEPVEDDESQLALTVKGSHTKISFNKQYSFTDAEYVSASRFDYAQSSGNSIVKIRADENYRISSIIVDDSKPITGIGLSILLNNGLVLSRQKNHSITVETVGLYYVYHSSSGTVETLDVSDTDITDNVRNGYLYAGYYKDESYTRPYTECGMNLTPEVGKIYYLKEISSAYACPALHVSYENSHGKTVSGMYLITAMDSNEYSDVGFIIDKGTDAGVHSVRKLAGTVSIFDDASASVYDSHDFFNGLNNSADVLSVKQYFGEANGAKVTAYYTTYDMVRVTGCKQCTISTRGNSQNIKFDSATVASITDNLAEGDAQHWSVSMYETVIIKNGTLGYANYVPGDPTDPINPDDPGDPVDPVKPSDPVDPIKPGDPVDPVKPGDPVDPVKPVDPVGPVKPDKPDVPDKPDKPDKPEDTDTPSGNVDSSNNGRTSHIYHWGSNNVPGSLLPAPPQNDKPKEVEITMNINGETITVKGNEGCLAEQLDIPEMDNSLFAGWYIDEELTVPADLDSIDENTSLFAKFISDDDISVGVSKARLFSGTYKSTVKMPSGTFESCGFVCVVGNDEIHVYAEKVKPSIFDWSKKDIEKYAGEWNVSLHTGDELTVIPCFKTIDGSTVYGDPATYVYCLGFFL